MSRTRLHLTVLLGCLTTTASQAAVRYLDADAPAGGDGSSWNQAFKYLQDALAVAVRSDEIRVAEGTYRPDEDDANPTGTGDRAASFQLMSGVALFGGYAGNGQPDPDHRDVALHETTLSGDLAENDGPDFANNDENSSHIVMVDGTDPAARIDGFTIRGGKSELSSPGGGAAGVRVVAGKLVLDNCIVMENDALEYGDGAGMNILPNSEVTMSNCDFVANKSWIAGAIDNSGILNASNCTFRENLAEMSGGAIAHHDHPTFVTLLRLTGCTFTDNLADNPIIGVSGGALSVVILDNGPVPMLIDCLFIGNVASFSGGAINGSEPMLINCVFLGNHAHCEGGAFNGGDAIMVNCLFSGNTAGDYGGALSINGTPYLTNCTFTGNTAGISGGGIYGHGITRSHPRITNCILWGNRDAGATDESAQIHVDRGSPRVNYSCIQGGWTGLGGLGIVTSDPLFADAEGPDNVPGTLDDNLRLRPGSPCMDAGDNLSVPEDRVDLDSDGDTIEPIPWDLDGGPRFLVDPTAPGNGNGTPPIVDIGAYEGPLITEFPDFDNDGDVDLNDFATFASCFAGAAVTTPPSACSPADFAATDLDGDGDVDLSDFATLAMHFTG